MLYSEISLRARRYIYIYKVIFNEDANVTKWFTEGSSEEY